MKVAVACDGLEVASHATQCTSFMCYTISRGVITDGRNLPNLFTTSQEIARLLRDIDVGVLIAHEFPGVSAEIFQSVGIEVIVTDIVLARTAANTYLSQLMLDDIDE